MPEAIFKKFKLYSDDTDDIVVEPDLVEPFDQILSPIKGDIKAINKTKADNPTNLHNALEKTIHHIKEYFECDGLLHPIQTHSTKSNFFSHNSSSKDFLVERRGIESRRLACKT